MLTPRAWVRGVTQKHTMEFQLRRNWYALLLAGLLGSTGWVMLVKPSAAADGINIANSTASQPPLTAEQTDIYRAQASNGSEEYGGPGTVLLQTATNEQAERQLEDGTLFRMGSRTLLHWNQTDLANLPQALQLDRGTLLLVVPEDASLSINTPTVTANIAGVALFVRYIPETQTTVIGALTEGISLSIANERAQHPLQAGQILRVAGQSDGTLYDFDLATFYGTSTLAGQIMAQASPAGQDMRLQGVLQKLRVAVQGQQPVDGEQVIENPTFIANTTDEAAAGTMGGTANGESQLGDAPTSEVLVTAPASESDAPAQLETDVTTPAVETEGLEDAPNVLDAVDFESSISAEINPSNSPSEGASTIDTADITPPASASAATADAP